MEDSWLPYQIAFFLGAIILFRKYMQGGKCYSKNRIDGKTVIITGANSGIGKETAKELAKRGGRIILACRDIVKGRIAVSEIKSYSKNENIVFRKLDLASFKSIREFADVIIEEVEKIDILINNAGVMLAPFALTEDGFETHFQVNYLGHFLLTHLLLDKLKASRAARIINITALAHYAGQINFEDLNCHNEYIPREAYAQSKLAIVLFTLALSEKLKDTNVTVNCLHPGIVRTSLSRYTDFDTNKFWKVVLFPWVWLLLKTAKDGAQTSIYCSISEELEKVTGKTFADCALKEPSEMTKDQKLIDSMWEVSLKLTNLSKEVSNEKSQE